MALPITLSCPLPPQDLLFESMRYRAGLSELGEVALELLSPQAALDPQKLLGQPMTVSLALHDGGQRHVCGLVSAFGIGRDRAGAAAGQGRYFSYRATLRPWLWFLGRTADCRIFQDLSVPDIVRQVFADHDVARFEFKLFRSYRKLGYCVQYRESDLNFVARLLEHEGIYWYFEHAAGSHTLVLVDAASAHDPAPGCPSLRYIEDLAHAPPDQEFASGWRYTESVRSGKVVLTDYDFERPSTPLAVDVAREHSHAQAAHEVFDYPGGYLQTADGHQYAENTIDAWQARHVLHHAHANALGLEVGRRLAISRHPREALNADYLVTGLALTAQVAEHGGGTAVSRCDCEFDAIPADQTFRPLPMARKPFVQGPQTAVVVGPAGEEIFTDKYGRVKLQFHWDRLGRRDEKSSCWVRVSQPWAGKNFGFMQIPRIGQEVVVDFLEGDPDQPLITGRVYNAEQMPPWDLPANATQSGVLSRSSQGGAYGHANALRFEDKKGSEQLWLHAEKDQSIEVENDETHWVGHDRGKTVDHDETTEVKHDRTETVGNNETITIGVNRSESVGSNEDISIGVNRSESVGANESITVGANRSISVGGSESASVALQRTHTVGVNETIAIGAGQEVAIGAAQVIAVGAAQSITVGANQSTDVGANQSTTVGSSRSIEVGGAQTTKVAKARSADVGEDDSVKVGKNLVIDAGDSVTLKTGSASLTMKKDGTITLKGKDITIQGSGKVNVKASGDVIVKGSKVLQN